MSRVAHVSILICTRDRPDELERCLRSLNTLRFAAGPHPEIDIVVVDNSGGASRTRSDAELAKLSGHPTQVVVEPRRGIPMARNKALAHRHGSADHVAFIDDDETAVPRWLDHLLAEARTRRAELVTGPVLTRLPLDTSAVVRDWYARVRGGRAPTGTRLPAAATNNLLIDCRWLADSNLRFDERIGLGSGGDTDFSVRARQTGAKIVWADRAMVWEWIPPTRATARAVVRDAWTYGATKERFAPALGLAAGLGAIPHRLSRELSEARRAATRSESIAMTVQSVAETAGRLGQMAGLRTDRYKHVVTTSGSDRDSHGHSRNMTYRQHDNETKEHPS